MLPFFGWKAAALVALLLQTTIVAAFPGLDRIALLGTPIIIVSSASSVASSSATVNSITTRSGRRILTRSVTITRTPTVIVPVTGTVTAGALSAKVSAAGASSDVAFVETVVVTDLVVVDPVASSTYTTELVSSVDASSSSSTARVSSSTTTTSSSTPSARTRHRTFIKTTVTSTGHSGTGTPTTTQTFTFTAPTVTVVEVITVWPKSDKKGPILTVVTCEGKPYRVHYFHNPFNKPFGCPKPKPQCPRGRKCHPPMSEPLDKRTEHLLDATSVPVTITSDGALAATTTATIKTSESGAAASSPTTGTSHRRTINRTTTSTVTPPATKISVTEVVVATAGVDRTTLEQAKKGCIECADTKDNGLIPPESIVQGKVSHVPVLKGRRSNTVITPIQLSPVNNISLTVSDSEPTLTIPSRRRSRASHRSLVARAAASNQPEPLPRGPTSVYDPILPLNLTFSEILLPLDKDAFIAEFNFKYQITDPTKSPLYNLTLNSSPAVALGLNTTSILANGTSTLGASSVGNGTTYLSHGHGPRVNNYTSTLDAFHSNASILDSSYSSLSHGNDTSSVDKRSTACNCAHNNDAHSWRDTMSPVERATEICIAGGGCKITRDYEEMCVMVGGGPDPCACIAGAIGDYQSHHRSVWWIWSAVHCGGTAVVVANR